MRKRRPHARLLARPGRTSSLDRLDQYGLHRRTPLAGEVHHIWPTSLADIFLDDARQEGVEDHREGRETLPVAAELASPETFGQDIRGGGTQVVSLMKPSGVDTGRHTGRMGRHGVLSGFVTA